MRGILAFGNALIDIRVTPSPALLQQLLDKYCLQSDSQKEISQSEMSKLTDDISLLEKQISPGGCSQNSLRVMQWVLRGKCKTAAVFGSIGRDNEGEVLRRRLEAEGIQPRYIIIDGLPTGKVVALVSGNTRCLVAHIGAASSLPLQLLLAHPEFQSVFDRSDIIYMEAFFLTNRFETAKHIVDMCYRNNKLIAFNLCGDYIFNLISESIKYLVECSYLVFGNKVEYEALSTLLNYSSIESLAQIAVENGKTFVITDGPRTIKCYSKSGIITRDPPSIHPSQIKDTIAAGDAFVGGFLAGLCMTKDLNDCIDIGIYAAANMIRQSGCSLPPFESEVLTL